VFADPAWNAAGSGLIAGNASQVGAQAITIVVVAAYSGAVTFGLLKLLGLLLPLRVDESDEGVGLDVTQHGEEAYADGEGAILVLPEPREIP
jgi:Amt family ammonium transporter